MAEIDDRHDVAPLQLGERHVGEGPVVAARADEGLVQRRTVAQEPDVQVLEQLEIRPPVFVMAALLHLVDADAAVLMVGMLFSIPVANMKVVTRVG